MIVRVLMLNILKWRKIWRQHQIIIRIQIIPYCASWAPPRRNRVEPGIPPHQLRRRHSFSAASPGISYFFLTGRRGFLLLFCGRHCGWIGLGHGGWRIVRRLLRRRRRRLPGEELGEVEPGVLAAQLEGLAVVGHGGVLRRVEGTEPEARPVPRQPDLRHPLPPVSLPHAAVELRRRHRDHRGAEERRLPVLLQPRHHHHPPPRAQVQRLAPVLQQPQLLRRDRPRCRRRRLPCEIRREGHVLLVLRGEGDHLPLRLEQWDRIRPELLLLMLMLRRRRRRILQGEGKVGRRKRRRRR